MSRKQQESSSNAQHNPVFSPSPELSTGEFNVPQLGPIDVDRTLEVGREPIVIAERLPSVQYAEELKFNEDPVTIVLTPSSDRNAPKQVYCAVNGKGAEVWDEKSKRWIEFKYIPVGRMLTVKRKYIEVLARSRADSFSTREVSPTPHANQDGYVLESYTVPTAPVTIRHDPAGDKGHQWFARVMQEF
jgi:hypothetical protein